MLLQLYFWLIDGVSFMMRSIKNKKIRSVLLGFGLAYLLFWVSFFGNVRPVEADDDTIYTLKIFETSDVHGAIAMVQEDGTQYRMAFISDKVKDVRGYGDAYRKDKAILVDTGDVYQGTVLSNLQKGQCMAAAYEYMDYDAVGVGNHEFDWGIETVINADKTMRDYDFGGYTGVNDVPITVSNMYRYGEKLALGEDYIILDKVATDADGNEIPVKVAIIGFADDYSSSEKYSQYTGLGYDTKLDYDELNALASSLEDSGACDATVVLFHGEAKICADSLGSGSKVDLVLGGHTHKNANGVTDWGLPYLQPTSSAAAYTTADLEFKKIGDDTIYVDSANRRYERVTKDIQKLYNLPENVDELDKDIIDISDAAIADVDEVLKTNIGYITETASKSDFIPESSNHSTTCGNWMASILQRAVNADIGIVNTGAVRRGWFVKDGSLDINYSDVYEMFPFDDELYVYEITYEDLKEAMEYSCTKSGRGLLSRMVGINVYLDGTDFYALETTDGSVIYVDGKWKGDWKDKKVRIAVTEFCATTERTEEGYSNPLIEWNNDARLVSHESLIRDGAFKVLEQEAAENDGHLNIDTHSYFINEHKQDPHWYLTYDGVLTIEKEIGEIPENMFEKYSDQKTVVFEGTAEEWYAMKISDKWLIESKDVSIKCNDKTIIAASYMCVNYNQHEYDAPTYSWSEDNSKVTASHFCPICENEETETVESTSGVTKEATETEAGERTYTAEFKNPAFEKQIKKVEIPKLTPSDDPGDDKPAEPSTENSNATPHGSGGNTPSTGDEAMIIPFMIVFMLSALAVVVIVIEKSRGKKTAGK